MAVLDGEHWRHRATLSGDGCCHRHLVVFEARATAAVDLWFDSSNATGIFKTTSNSNRRVGSMDA